MLTKELSTPSRAQPLFIEPIQVVPVRELPDGAAWSYEAISTGIAAMRPREVMR